MSTERHMINTVDRVYGQALLELADEAGRLGEIAEQVDALEQLLADNPDVVQLMSNLSLSRQQRRSIVENIFHDKFDPLLYQFLQVLSSRDRLGALPGIVRCFPELVDEHQQVVAVDVYAAHKLDSDDVGCIEQSLLQSLNKKVRLRLHKDAELLGGLKFRIGDRLIDASVQARLHQMKQTLIDAGRRSARQMVQSTSA